MVISGLYMYVVDSVPVYHILGYDVPACGSRVPFIYTVHVSYCFIYDIDGCILIWSLAGVIYTAIYMYDWRLGLAGSRHLAYLYVLFACFILRRPVPIFGPGGLLSVK